MKGNRGHGLGRDFATSLHENLHTVFRDFGEEEITRSSHIEKLCLVRDGVGRDNLSDFVTNLIKKHLAEYTQHFAREHLDSAQLARFALPKVEFDYATRTWATQYYELPCFDNDYVLLTPKDLLTKDEAWINRPDLLNRLRGIANSLPDSVLRAQVNQYLLRVLPTNPRAKKDEIQRALSRVVDRFPVILDYYIKRKEETGDRATSIAKARVAEVQTIFVTQIRQLVTEFLQPMGFYSVAANTYEEARQRLLYLKGRH